MRGYLITSMMVTMCVLLTIWAASGSTAAQPGEIANGRDTNMGKVLRHELLTNQSTIIGALRTVFQGTELAHWSAAGLQGVLGHAFNWNMNRGAGEIWQEDYLDYHFGFQETLPEIARFRVIKAYQASEPGDFDALKAGAWDAVRKSIDRGHPAIAWQPMTVEQKAAGIRAGAWGVLTGYDLSEKTYTVRHQYNKQGEAFTVAFDGFGHTDPGELFCVLVYEGPAEVEPEDVHLKALRNAISFSEGIGSESETYLEPDGRGFTAYELWLDALESGDVDAKQSGIHAYKLSKWREHAAAYIRELVGVLPEAGAQLEAAASRYEAEVEVLGRLETHCFAARDAGGFTTESLTGARTMLQAALDADRNAMALIREALDVLMHSR